MGVQNLRVEKLQAPVGIDGRAPSFSFESDVDEGLFSVALFSGENKVAEQERTVLGEECRSFRFFQALAEGTLYRWEVSDGRTCVSSHFETAERFDFPFITAEMMTETLPAFCTAVDIPNDTRAARLYIAASCAHAVFFNREKVGGVDSGVGEPQDAFMVYNVSGYLWRGSENSLRVLLSRHTDVRLAVGLVLYLRDGRRRVYTTDETWQIYESGILWDSVCNCERYDRWNLPSESRIRAVLCDTGTYPKHPRCMLPEQRRACSAVKIRARANGGWVVDFGHIVRGFIRFRIKPRPGEWVCLYLSATDEEPAVRRSEYDACMDAKTDLYEPVLLGICFGMYLFGGCPRPMRRRSRPWKSLNDAERGCSIDSKYKLYALYKRFAQAL